MIRDAPTMTLAPHPARRRPRLGRAPRATLGATAALVGILGVLLFPALATAHPLGNFTINHYTGIRVEPGRILLDVVIDQAEIPTFQARLDFDTDGDGEVSDAETEAGRVTACNGLAPSLALTVDGAPMTLTLIEAGLTFPPGVGGLSTMRMVCGFVATPGAPLAAGSQITYADTFATDRLGWREIVVTGSGMTLAGSDGELRATSTSARLTAYPTNLLTQALADRRAAFTASPGGPTLPALDIPDATPLTAATEVPVASAQPSGAVGAGTGVAATTPTSPSSGSATAVAGNVPGGVGSGELPSIFRTADLTPVVLLISILTAAALGAGHAVTPGHGKTLMAAYLVGTRGTPLHAAGLGLSVTLSHTLGILVLAGLVVGAQGVLPPDVVVKWAPVVAAFSIVAIGGWMLVSEARRRWRRRAGALVAHEHGYAGAHDHPHSHDHDHGHAQSHATAAVHDHDHVPAANQPGSATLRDHDHAPAANQPVSAAVHGHAHAPAVNDAAPAGEHSHGGVRHTHLPAAGSTISWRSLFVLGLAGGLIPSTSALLILLGSIAAGRPAFGFVLVVAFGLGMALVMGGIGLALVLARGRLDRVDSTSRLGRASGYVPLAAAFVVFGFGLYLTIQAISGNATF